jgi:hypothetical protein
MPRLPKPSGPKDRDGAAPPSGPTRVGTAPVAPGSSPREEGAGLPLPHERDEAANQVSPVPDPRVAQAKRDLDAGQVDTDLRATPGLDADKRADLMRPQPTRR